MILITHLADGNIRTHVRSIEDLREIETLGLVVADGLFHVQKVGSADHFVHASEAELGHGFANFFSDEPEEVHDMFGSASELLTQVFILGRNTHRAGAEMADPHHDAAHDHQRCRGESEFFSAQKGSHHHIATGLHLTVGLNHDPVPKIVQYQCLLGFGQTEFPRNTGMFE